LALGPTDGDLAALINKTTSGKTVDFDDKKSLKSVLLSYFASYQKKELKVRVTHLSDYHVKNITRKLAQIINSI